MRRADRLFLIIQRLRRRGVVTAAKLAEALEVSERTIYRDVRDLILAGVPIQGEAGVGYALPKGFDIPPLMFTEEEIEALVLGARVVEAWGDPALARAAQDVLSKVESVLPARLKERIPDATLFAPSFHVRGDRTRDLGPLRGAIRDRRKVRLSYRDHAETPSTRVVRPLGLFYWGPTWSVGAWCELRDGFRNFRTDRIVALDVLDERFSDEPGKTIRDLFAHYRAEGAAGADPMV